MRARKGGREGGAGYRKEGERGEGQWIAMKRCFS